MSNACLEVQVIRASGASLGGAREPVFFELCFDPPPTLLVDADDQDAAASAPSSPASTSSSSSSLSVITSSVTASSASKTPGPRSASAASVAPPLLRTSSKKRGYMFDFRRSNVEKAALEFGDSFELPLDGISTANTSLVLQCYKGTVMIGRCSVALQSLPKQRHVQKWYQLNDRRRQNSNVNALVFLGLRLDDGHGQSRVHLTHAEMGARRNSVDTVAEERDPRTPVNAAASGTPIQTSGSAERGGAPPTNGSTDIASQGHRRWGSKPRSEQAGPTHQRRHTQSSVSSPTESPNSRLQRSRSRLLSSGMLSKQSSTSVFPMKPVQQHRDTHQSQPNARPPLIEYLCIVGFEESSAAALEAFVMDPDSSDCPVPVIIQSFPDVSERPQVALPHLAAMMCFPDAHYTSKQPKKTCTFSFCLSTQQLHCSALVYWRKKEFPSGSVYLPVALVLSSRYPLSSCLCLILSHMYKNLGVEDHHRSPALYRFIASLCAPLPQVLPALAYLHLRWGRDGHVIPVRLRAAHRYSFAPLDVSLAYIIRLLGIHTLTAAVVSLLCGRSMVIHASQKSLLQPIAEALRAMVVPLKLSSFIYVPLLPRAAMTVLQSPVPFIVGCTNECLQDNHDQIQQSQPDLVFLDVDAGKLNCSTSLPLLPQEPAYNLVTRVRKIILGPLKHADHMMFSGQHTRRRQAESSSSSSPLRQQHSHHIGHQHRHGLIECQCTGLTSAIEGMEVEHAIRVAFLEFMGDILSDYREFLAFDSRDEVTFDAAAFLERRDHSARPLLSRLIQTQAFLEFLNAHSDEPALIHDLIAYTKNAASPPQDHHPAPDPDEDNLLAPVSESTSGSADGVCWSALNFECIGNLRQFGSLVQPQKHTSKHDSGMDMTRLELKDALESTSSRPRLCSAFKNLLHNQPVKFGVLCSLMELLQLERWRNELVSLLLRKLRPQSHPENVPSSGDTLLVLRLDEPAFEGVVFLLDALLQYAFEQSDFINAKRVLEASCCMFRRDGRRDARKARSDRFMESPAGSAQHRDSPVGLLEQGTSFTGHSREELMRDALKHARIWKVQRFWAYLLSVQLLTASKGKSPSSQAEQNHRNADTSSSMTRTSSLPNVVADDPTTPDAASVTISPVSSSGNSDSGSSLDRAVAWPIDPVARQAWPDIVFGELCSILCTLQSLDIAEKTATNFTLELAQQQHLQKHHQQMRDLGTLIVNVYRAAAPLSSQQSAARRPLQEHNSSRMDAAPSSTSSAAATPMNGGSNRNDAADLDGSSVSQRKKTSPASKNNELASYRVSEEIGNVLLSARRRAALSRTRTIPTDSNSISGIHHDGSPEPIRRLKSRTSRAESL